MLKYSQFVNAENALELTEALITFGGQAYPKFGNVVIMAGGAGSGKGFVKDKLVGVEGFTFDVDELKTMAAKTPLIVKKAKEEYDMDLKALAGNLKKPENVSALHYLIGSYMKLDDRRVEALYRSIISAAPERKPNLIFDVTLKNLRKLEEITYHVRALGYDPKNIHIVWVVNDIQVAIDQNENRDRTVPVEILVNTHRGVSATMHDILQMGKSLNKYMDGDIVIAFNKVKVDSTLKKSSAGGSYIKDANYFYVKKSGEPSKSVYDLGKDLRLKIKQYTPKNIDWLPRKKRRSTRK